MLPFTTYNIPENQALTPPNSAQWLWVITEKELTEEDKELLTKIISALKVNSLQDVFICQIKEGEKISLAEIGGSPPGLIISFGVEPDTLGLWIDLPKPGLITLEPFTFIRTKSLTDLAQSTNSKKQLWGAMKTFLENQS